MARAQGRDESFRLKVIPVDQENRHDLTANFRWFGGSWVDACTGRSFFILFRLFSRLHAGGSDASLSSLEREISGCLSKKSRDGAEPMSPRTCI